MSGRLHTGRSDWMWKSDEHWVRVHLLADAPFPLFTIATHLLVVGKEILDVLEDFAVLHFAILATLNTHANHFGKTVRRGLVIRALSSPPLCEPPLSVGLSGVVCQSPFVIVEFNLAGVAEPQVLVEFCSFVVRDWRRLVLLVLVNLSFRTFEFRSFLVRDPLVWPVLVDLSFRTFERLVRATLQLFETFPKVIRRHIFAHDRNEHLIKSLKIFKF